MSGLHDLGKPWYEQDTTMAVFFVGSILAYGIFVIVPLLRGEWAWSTHSPIILLATGVLMGVFSLPAWAASTDRASRPLRLLALALTVLAFVAVAIPAFLIDLPHSPIAQAH